MAFLLRKHGLAELAPPKDGYLDNAPYREPQNTISLDLVDGPFAESNEPEIWVAEVTLGNPPFPAAGASGACGPHHGECSERLPSPLISSKHR